MLTRRIGIITFDIVLLLCSILCFVSLSSCTGQSRLMPLFTGIGLLILVAFQITLDVMNKKINWLKSSSFSAEGLNEDENELVEVNNGVKGKEKEESIFTIRIFAWLLVCIVAMYYFNYIAVMSVYILAFMYTELKVPFIKSVMSSVLVGGFIYVVFELILKANLG